MKLNVQPPDVLIVGAGPVGLFAALALTRQHVPVRIIDKAPGPGVYSYGLALHAATLDMFARFDLLEAVMRFALPLHRVGIFGEGKRIAELDLDKLPRKNPYLAIIPQSAIESILIEALARAGVAVDWNHRLASLHLEPGGVTGRIERREQRMMGYATTHLEWMVDDVRPFHVPYLIGADGHESLARQFAQIPFPPTGEEDYFTVFEFETSKATEPEVKLAFSGGKLNVGWPLSRFRYRWGFQIEAPGEAIDAREKEREFGQIGDGAIQRDNIEQLLGYLKERVPNMAASVQKVDWHMIVRFEHALADYFNEGNVCLVGDSAHAANPAGVQSMNQGFAEADDLATVLARVLRDGNTHDGLEAWALRARAEWIHQMALAESPDLPGAADPSVVPYAARLVESLPGASADLQCLLRQLAFKVPELSSAAP